MMRVSKCCNTVLMLLLLCVAGSRADARQYLGITVQPRKGGLLISQISGGSPAVAGGLRKGDLLTHWDDSALTGLRTFWKLLSGSRGGQQVRFTVQRKGQEKPLKLTVVIRRVLDLFPKMAGRRTRHPDQPASLRFAALVDKPDYLERALRKLADKHGLSGEVDLLQGAFERSLKHVDGFYRLAHWTAVHRRPLALPRVADALTGPLRAIRPGSEFLLLKSAAVALDLPAPAMPERWPAWNSREQALQGIARMLAVSAQARSRAFAGLSPDEQAFLISQAPKFLFRFAAAIYLHVGNPQQIQANARFLRLTRKVNFAALFEASAPAAFRSGELENPARR